MGRALADHHGGVGNAALTASLAIERAALVVHDVGQLVGDLGVLGAELTAFALALAALARHRRNLAALALISALLAWILTEFVLKPLVAERIDPRARADAPARPVCAYLETTNRCNLLCTTCPRTYEELEPPADMSWELFTGIVDQVPRIARVVLHGVGEPMMVKNLPRMIRYLKGRGVYVLFNTNGTLLAPKKRRELIDTGLDELRVSLDAADAERFFKVRGKAEEWQAGKFVHPHDACFDRDGNIFVVEWVHTGRVTLLRRV